MDEYKKWLKESRYIIIKKRIDDGAYLSIFKCDICIHATDTGYFGCIELNKNLHTYWINVRKCRFMTKLLKDAYMFDAYNFSRRCRKEKLNKIEECQKYLS